MMQELHDHNLFSANSVGEVTEGVMLCRAPLKIDFLYITDIEPNSTDQDFSLNDLVNSVLCQYLNVKCSVLLATGRTYPMTA